MTAHDISLFLEKRFAEIRHVKDVPLDWPGDDKIRAITTMSVPLFISAATICRFVEAKLDPVESLADLLQNQAKYATKMDKMYLPILTGLLKDWDDDDAESRLQQIVGAIILLAIPLSVNALSGLIHVQKRVINHLLNSLRSVLSVPSDNLPVRIFHLSFRDFLIQTGSNFRVDVGHSKHRYMLCEDYADPPEEKYLQPYKPWHQTGRNRP